MIQFEAPAWSPWPHRDGHREHEARHGHPTERPAGGRAQRQRRDGEEQAEGHAGQRVGQEEAGALLVGPADRHLLAIVTVGGLGLAARHGVVGLGGSRLDGDGVVDARLGGHGVEHRARQAREDADEQRREHDRAGAREVEAGEHR